MKLKKNLLKIYPYENKKKVAKKQNKKMKINSIKKNTKVSVIIPCYNEKATISKIITKVSKVNINIEIIVVDDNSDDGSKKKIKNLKNKLIIKKIFHKKNLGKGACIRSATKFVSGDIVLIQDADLEYNPNDYYKLLKPFKSKNINVVYGSRVLNKKRFSLKASFSVNFRVFANLCLTLFSNIVNFQNLTDAHTCYKLVRSKLFKKLDLKENDFSFCPELTTKLSNNNEKIIEVPISYRGRSYSEGKKIRLYDAFRVIYVIFKHRLRF